MDVESIIKGNFVLGQRELSHDLFTCHQRRICHLSSRLTCLPNRLAAPSTPLGGSIHPVWSLYSGRLAAPNGVNSGGAVFGVLGRFCCIRKLNMLYFRNLGCENRLKPKAGFGDFVYLQLRCGQPWGSPKGVLLPLGPLITRGAVEGREYKYIDCPKPRGDGKAGGNCAFRAMHVSRSLSRR